MHEILIKDLNIPEHLLQVPVIGVGIIVPHPEFPDKILCVEEAKANDKIGKMFGMISFPMGHLIKGEHPEEAATRELLEETGFEARAEYLVGLYVINSEVAGLVYAASLLNSNPKKTKNIDIKRTFWGDLSKMDEFFLRPGVDTMLYDYQNGYYNMVRDLRS